MSPARKLSLWERIFGARCDHDWFDKATMEYARVKDGTVVAHTFIKECRKCHRIWAQKVGIYNT